MRLSTKGRYAMRAALDLACQSPTELVPVKDIARRQGISRLYLEQIMGLLKAGGIVRSTVGPNGGFSLNRPASEIKLIEILEVTEGSLAPVACVDDPHICPRSPSCMTRYVWIEMKKAMCQVLEGITLKDMADGKLKQPGFKRQRIDRRSSVISHAKLQTYRRTLPELVPSGGGK